MEEGGLDMVMVMVMVMMMMSWTTAGKYPEVEVGVI
jgi:hypothetical protein